MKYASMFLAAYLAFMPLPVQTLPQNNLHNSGSGNTKTLTQKEIRNMHLESFGLEERVEGKKKIGVLVPKDYVFEDNKTVACGPQVRLGRFTKTSCTETNPSEKTNITLIHVDPPYQSNSNTLRELANQNPMLLVYYDSNEEFIGKGDTARAFLMSKGIEVPIIDYVLGMREKFIAKSWRLHGCDNLSSEHIIENPSKTIYSAVMWFLRKFKMGDYRSLSGASQDYSPKEKQKALETLLWIEKKIRGDLVPPIPNAAKSTCADRL